MGIPILGDVIDAVGKLASEVIVDKDKRNEILFKLEELKDRDSERLHEELMGQIDVNKIEASSASLFVAGWRPFVGWVSGFGVAWTFVLSPLVEWIARLFGWLGKMPVIDSGQLMTLVLAMLGIGAQRSYEKANGVSTEALRPKPTNPDGSRKKFLGII